MADGAVAPLAGSTMTGAVAPLARESTCERDRPKKATAGPFSRANPLQHGANEHARKVINKALNDYLIPDHSNDLPKLTKAEVTQGKILSMGGFGTVCEVHAFDDAPLQKSRSLRLLRDNVDDDEVSVGDIGSRKFVAECCTRNGAEDARHMLSSN